MKDENSHQVYIRIKARYEPEIKRQVPLLYLEGVWRDSCMIMVKLHAKLNPWLVIDGKTLNYKGCVLTVNSSVNAICAFT